MLRKYLAHEDNRSGYIREAILYYEQLQLIAAQRGIKVLDLLNLFVNQEDKDSQSSTDLTSSSEDINRISKREAHPS